MKGFKSVGKPIQSGHSFPSSFGFSKSSSAGSPKAKPAVKATAHMPKGMSGSSKGHIIGESTRAYKKGGAVNSRTMPPKLPKSDAPKGNVNFSDFSKGGKARAGKK